MVVGLNSVNSFRGSPNSARASENWQGFKSDGALSFHYFFLFLFFFIFFFLGGGGGVHKLR
jgi:hypothetical protein